MRAPYDEWFGLDAFDATYGYDAAALAAIRAAEEPPGFAEFWTGLYAKAAAVVTEPVLAGVGRERGHRVHTVSFTSFGGVRLGGWVTFPEAGPAERAIVVGHGYGGRAGPDLDVVPDGAAAIFPVARGLPTASLLPGVGSTGATHVLHGIESVDTYVHGGCAADVWCAATALLELLPEPPQRLDYVGSSFGGGIGALALPWDDRFDAAVLHVPSFGRHDLRLTMPCTGSGEAVRGHVADHPEACEVLRYFDAAAAAGRIRVPTLVAPALWDPSVPPPGQFAVFNALTGRRERYVFSAGHAEYPTAEVEYRGYLDAVHAFLDGALGG